MPELVLDNISGRVQLSLMQMRRPRAGHRRSPSALVGTLALLAVASTAVASLGAPLLPMIERVYGVSLAASQWALTVTLLTGRRLTDWLPCGVERPFRPVKMIDVGCRPMTPGSGICVG